MKPIIQLIQRLRAADDLLACEGLHVPSFAATQGIDEQGVRRLLATLEALGHPVVVRYVW